MCWRYRQAAHAGQQGDVMCDGPRPKRGRGGYHSGTPCGTKKEELYFFGPELGLGQAIKFRGVEETGGRRCPQREEEKVARPMQ